MIGGVSVFKYRNVPVCTIVDEITCDAFASTIVISEFLVVLLQLCVFPLGEVDEFGLGILLNL
jgi:hypothetical protein